MALPPKTITALNPAAALTGAEPVETVQAGVSVQTTTQDIADLSGGITQLAGDVTTPAGGGLQVSTISAGAVTSAKLANGAATTLKIADDNVTFAKLQNATGQALVGATAAGDFQEIGVGAGLAFNGTDLEATGAVASAVEVQDEGIVIDAAAAILNFTGAGVTATQTAPGEVDVNIPGGGGGGALTLVSTQAIGGTAGASWTGIAAAGEDLIVVVRGRTAEAVAASACTLRLNNDSGANYNRLRMGTTNGSTVTTNALAGETGVNFIMPGASETAGKAGAAEITVFDYKGTTFNKTTLVDEGYYSTSLNMRATQWANTAAVNRVDVVVVAGSNFAAGSTASLYIRT